MDTMKKVPDASLIPETPTCSVPDACRVLGISKSSGYEAIKRGEMKVIEMGRSKRVITAWLRKILEIE
jgi:excisionase family DNA binding protein